MAAAITMRDFLMSAGCKQAMAVPPEYARAVADFLDKFELVFGDADWPITLANLQADAKYLIDSNGTFIDPGVADESNNWHNRGSLLAAYRRLKAILVQPQFGVIELHPCGVVTKARPAATEPPDDCI